MAAKSKLAPARGRPTAARLDARDTFRRLREFHADAHCELDHKNPFELLVATVLSAQTTDVIVNRITPDLFAAYPDARSLAAAPPADVERILNRMGMFRQKTKNIIGLSKKLVAEHNDQVPRSLAQLIELPGVGRKTANVVLGVAWNTPEGVVVDTHVQRISQRLGWTRETTPEKIEQDLVAAFPKEDWDMLSHVLIFHGRRVCFARKPSCATCVVNDICPSAFHAEHVGRKSVIRLAAKLDGAKPTLAVAKAKAARAAKVKLVARPAQRPKRPGRAGKALVAKPPPA